MAERQINRFMESAVSGTKKRIGCMGVNGSVGERMEVYGMVKKVWNWYERCMELVNN